MPAPPLKPATGDVRHIDHMNLEFRRKGSVRQLLTSLRWPRRHPWECPSFSGGQPHFRAATDNSSPVGEERRRRFLDHEPRLRTVLL
jgi:hypothetical protein